MARQRTTPADLELLRMVAVDGARWFTRGARLRYVAGGIVVTARARRLLAVNLIKRCPNGQLEVTDAGGAELRKAR